MPLQLTFVTSAKRYVDLPDSPGEVAFVGRSNVGKSSLINALANRRQLAKVSNTPGRTQLINLFVLPNERPWSTCPATATPRSRAASGPAGRR
jgi:GTP-binding protein